MDFLSTGFWFNYLFLYFKGEKWCGDDGNVVVVMGATKPSSKPAHLFMRNGISTATVLLCYYYYPKSSALQSTLLKQ